MIAQWWGVVVAVAVLGMVGGAWVQVMRKVPEAYMDEIFHVPQAQRYCAGDWSAASWDAKITTFPGVYVIAALAHWLSAMKLPCSVLGLRAMNAVVMNLAQFSLLVMLTRRQCRKGAARCTETDILLHALLLFLYPINFFYSLLYYTDTVSTTSLLLLAALTQQNDDRATPHPLTLLVAASASILMRQTNAVWVVFFGAVQVAGLTAMERRHRSSGGAGKGDTDPNDDLSGFLVHTLQHLPRILCSPRVWPLVVPVLGFVAFVFGYNKGSIVVGDAENHVPVLHLAQLAYFALVAVSLYGVVGIGSLLSWRGTWSSVCTTATRFPLRCLCVFGAFAAMLHYSTLAHPFLLADNRHYTFYVWRWVLGNPVVADTWWFRNLLALPAAAAVMVIVRKLREQQARQHVPRRDTVGSVIWFFALGCAIFLTLAPAHLLEPRYFTPGVYLVHIYSPPKSRLVLISGILISLVINLATVYMFTERPFVWGDGSTARFMW